MNMIREFYEKVSYIVMTYGETIGWFLFVTVIFGMLVGVLQ